MINGDRPEGIGIWRFSNGDFYEGNNAKGKLQGFGILKIYSKGDAIQGIWVEGKLSGRYKVIKTNGDTFEANQENSSNLYQSAELLR